LAPVVARYRDAEVRRFFWGDAAFANPDLYTFLEEKGYLYAIRLPGNQNSHRAIEHLLTRPVGPLPRLMTRLQLPALLVGASC